LSRPSEPVIVWAGSRVSVDFSGPELAVVFGAATGQNFFNVTVDGVTEIVGVPPGSGHRFVWPSALRAGRHRLELFKRSEADAGHVRWRGVELAAGAQAWAPERPDYRLKLEFIGDSITAGANNEDGEVDQWEDRRTHNHALSYGFLTSQAFHADHRAMAVSGMGICEGFVPMLAADTWDKIYPREAPMRVDFAAWQPDLVCINLGENDTAFTRNNGRPFPPGFTAGYVALVKAVRAAYPSAQIVLLRGGMGGGANDPALRTAWEAAVKTLEAADPKVAHFVFSHWTGHHPRVSDHRAMAAELTAWLRAQPWMASFE
ncbi:MAG TPA: GDSL-type esterase/lipase family protein, partial [Lacunisphaera sp.]|nr:GDSL-type esterase/lipase family protein [Lacunisphaera sp.]